MAVTKTALQTESQTALGLTSFLGGAALFFTGILIAQINNFSSTIKVPIAYLIISTFAFIFASIIYANVSGQIRMNRLGVVKRSILVANSLSEFLGIYLFIIAIPMVLSAITSDLVLRYIVDVAAIISLVLYTHSSFSIFRRSFTARSGYYFSGSLIAAMLVLYGIQGVNNTLYVGSSVFLILVLLAATILSEESKQ